jgi:hypothetical protein
MAVPYTFANATTSIPLSQLDSNFATAITLGNTAVYLGNTTTTIGNLTLTNANVSSVLTPITPAQGGTGLATLTANNVLIGNGTSNVTFVAPGTSGNVLTSNGTVWSSSAAPSPSAATPTSVGTVYGKTATTYTTAIGYNSALNANSSTDIVAIGVNALKTATSAFESVAIGDDALLSTTTAGYNTGVGHNVLRANTTGANNTGVGWYSLRTNSTGSDNTAIGYNTLQPATGSNNTALGSSALSSTTTGAGNVAIGKDTGSALTTGSYNIYIGYQTGNGTKTGGVDCIYIGRTITPNNATANGEMVINTNGNNQTGKGDGTGFITTGGNLYNGLNTSSWQTISDRRLKKNIVDNAEGLDIISQIRVRNFEYRTEEEVDAELKPQDVVQKAGVQLGVIAQELQEVCPDCVKQESSGVLSVNADNLTWHMINAIKDLKALNDTLTARIVALESK